MSKSYGKKVYDALNENKLKSLLILLEQDKGDEETENTNSSNSDENSSNSEDNADAIGDALAIDDDSDSEGDGEGAGEGEGEEDSDKEMADALDDEALKKSISDGETLLKNIAQHQSDPYSEIESLADAALNRAIINPKIDENLSIIKKYYKTNSIGLFINEADDQKVKKMADTMSDLEDQLKKYQDTVDQVVDGVDIHMPTFVKEALASLQSFDSKFSKADIIFKIFSNKLATSSGKNAEEKIKEFESLFYKELHKIDDSISKEDVIIPVEKTVTAAGAMKQG